MLQQLTDGQLSTLLQQIELTRRAWLPLLQSPRKDRGAWSRPDLSEPTAELERRLLKSFHQLGHDWITSLAGSSDDIVSGRLHQAKRQGTSLGEEEDALSYFDIPLDERDKTTDKSRLAALLALLTLWRNRHLTLVDAAGEDAFRRGRVKALSESKYKQASEHPETQQLRQRVVSRYEVDVDKLQEGLENGTVRSYGLRWIMENAPTVGAAAAYIRRLLNTEQYRVTLMSESLSWWGWEAGYRAGAIDATRDLLTKMGKPFPSEVSAEQLSDEEKSVLPRYTWDGPQDERACDECLGQFDESDVYALSPDDLPSPSEICRFGDGCRHTWVLVED